MEYLPTYCLQRYYFFRNKKKTKAQKMLDFAFSNRFALSCVEKHKPRCVPIGNKKNEGKIWRNENLSLLLHPKHEQNNYEYKKHE